MFGCLDWSRICVRAVCRIIGIDSLVKAHVSLCAAVGPGVDVIPLVSVPMHGLESGSMVRSMMDLDT